MIKAWNKQLISMYKKDEKFGLTVDMETYYGTLESIPSLKMDEQSRTAIVSPANSIGGMGGGFDETLCRLFASSGLNYKSRIETWIRNYLRHGYTPLGTAHVVEFFNYPQYELSKAWNNYKANSIVVLPTMRVPRNIYNVSVNDLEHVKEYKNREIVRFVFDCVWEILCAVSRHNEKVIEEDYKDNQFKGKVDTIIIPGLGTGYGGLPFNLVAKGMIGALYIWGINLDLFNNNSIDRGLMCLAFLNEDYTIFKNFNIVKSKHQTFHKDKNTFDVLKQNVGDFFDIICLKKDNVPIDIKDTI
jgi:O-acetyl-ADP-ribose deacetylase (regulator of RNase III)